MSAKTVTSTFNTPQTPANQAVTNTFDALSQLGLQPSSDYNTGKTQANDQMEKLFNRPTWMNDQSFILGKMANAQLDGIMKAFNISEEEASKVGQIIGEHSLEAIQHLLKKGGQPALRLQPETNSTELQPETNSTELQSETNSTELQSEPNSTAKQDNLQAQAKEAAKTVVKEAVKKGIAAAGALYGGIPPEVTEQVIGQAVDNTVDKIGEKEPSLTLKPPGF